MHPETIAVNKSDRPNLDCIVFFMFCSIHFKFNLAATHSVISMFRMISMFRSTVIFSAVPMAAKNAACCREQDCNAY